MPFREMKISLDDVSCLLCLLVTCKSVCQPKEANVHLAVKLLTHSLGVSHTEAFDEINTKSSTSICLHWLWEHFSGVNDIDSKERIICAEGHIYFIFSVAHFLGTRVV